MTVCWVWWGVGYGVQHYRVLIWVWVWGIRSRPKLEMGIDVCDYNIPKYTLFGERKKLIVATECGLQLKLHK